MILELPEDLTIARAGALKALLLAALDGAGDLELSARAVREADVAGLQLLCALRRSAAARGRHLAFARGGRGEALDAAIRAAGLGHGEDDRWLCEAADG